MKVIRKLSEEKEFSSFIDIVGNAYPGFNIETEEQKKKLIENYMKALKENPYVTFYGVFYEDKVLGGMRYHDFKMNLLSSKIKVGGIGLVAVDFLHKKEKIAKTIMTDFMEYYRKEGVSMAILYPFNPEFYKKMGFGFGTSMSQYSIKPSNLPKGESKSHIRYMKQNDAKGLLDCYTRIYEKTNGLMEKYEREFHLLFNNPNIKVVGYEKNNEIKAYMTFEFKSSHDKNTFVNDMVVNQLLFEDHESFMELMTFLNSQSDQINNVVFNIQDENFRFILDDPRNGSNNLLTSVYHESSTQGTGIMYRVIDTKGIMNELKNHNFNGVSCKLKITIKDSFIKDNDGSIIVDFTNGYPAVADIKEYDVEIKMDISDFSSLLTCVVSFNSLYKYGKAFISDEAYVQRVNSIFSSGEKPICMTIF